MGLSNREYARMASAGTCVSNVLLGVGTAQLPWLPVPWVWSGFFFLAALLAAVLFFRPHNARAVAYAGASTIVACFMRGAVVLLGRALGLPGPAGLSRWSVLLSATAFWTMAWLYALLFFTRMVFVASAERARSG